MKKDLMYYVHKNRQQTWSKIQKEARKTGKSVTQVLRETSQKARKDVK